ncbi:hypothetical protein [Aureimonas glaciei]|uniref:Uncharacterized protein n=1 Tax=Aureimonas glaciei TaxID=1776957 RepID=A0A916XUH6_9HYPH|nr:hypothetical protein [Aureimonas glaciei]GGD11857.1 hypothetical protein GCM10011335_13540 [Aureimonas glaciei]
MTALRAELREAGRFARHACSLLAKDVTTLIALAPWLMLIAFGSWEIGSQIVAARTATMIVGGL